MKIEIGSYKDYKCIDNVEIACLQPDITIFSEAKDITEGLFSRFLEQFRLKMFVLRIFGYS